MQPVQPTPLYKEFETDDDIAFSSQTKRNWRTRLLRYLKAGIVIVFVVGTSVYALYLIGGYRWSAGALVARPQPHVAPASSMLGPVSVPASVPVATSTRAAFTDGSANFVRDGSTGLTVTEQLAGDNKTYPVDGDVLFVHYTLTLRDGTVVESSRPSGRPFRFFLSSDRSQGIIVGWMKGLPMMSLGERAILFVPSAMGYGNKEHAKIPPDSDLFYDIHLLAINEKPWERLRITSMPVPGDGVHYPRNRDTVYLNFIGRTEDGKEFVRAIHGSGLPFRFGVGMDQVDFAMDFAVRMLSLGERAVFSIPSELAFGEVARGPIPPNSDLVYDLELIAITLGDRYCFDDDCPPPLDVGGAPVPDDALTAKAHSDSS